MNIHFSDAQLATPRTADALYDVAAERMAQVAKWGVQTRPDGTSRELYAARATVAKRATDHKSASGSVTWVDILTEEVMEAFEEDTDPEKLRTELIQVAAVALSWVEDIDRKEDDAYAASPLMAQKIAFSQARADATFDVVIIPDPSYPGTPETTS